MIISTPRHVFRGHRRLNVIPPNASVVRGDAYKGRGSTPRAGLRSPQDSRSESARSFMQLGIMPHPLQGHPAIGKRTLHHDEQVEHGVCPSEWADSYRLKTIRRLKDCNFCLTSRKKISRYYFAVEYSPVSPYIY